MFLTKFFPHIICCCFRITKSVFKKVLLLRCILFLNFFFMVRSLCNLCSKKICRQSNSIFCLCCSNYFHKKCVQNFFSDNFVCNLCFLKILPFFENSVQNNESLENNNNFPLQIKNYFQKCNSLDSPFDFEQLDNFAINSKYINVTQFNNDIKFDKNTSFLMLHLNIASINKYSESLFNFLSSLKHQAKLIAVTEHKISTNGYLFQQMMNYNFVFTPTSTTHGGAGFFIHNSLNFKERNDLTSSLNECYESKFVEIIFEHQKNIVCGCIYRHRHPGSSISNFNECFLSPLLEKLSKENKICVLSGDFNINLLNCNKNNFHF